MNLSPYDIKVLSYIKGRKDGRSLNDLKSKFGEDVAEIVKLMTAEQFIKIHEHNLAPFLLDPAYHDPPKGNYLIEGKGSLEVKRFRYSALLSRKERWKERLWGFFSGVAVSFLGGLILGWFLER